MRQIKSLKGHAASSAQPPVDGADDEPLSWKIADAVGRLVAYVVCAAMLVHLLVIALS